MDAGSGTRQVGQLTIETLDGLLEGYQLIGRDWRYLYVNEAAARHGRASKEQLIGRTMMEAYPGIEHTHVFSVLRKCMDERVAAREENEFQFPDGQKSWFELRVEPVAQGVMILSIDIGERKRTEEALRRSHRALMTLSDCNQTLVRASDELSFMRDVCTIAVDKGGYRMAWIGVKEHDAERSVRVLASAGMDGGYTRTLVLRWDDSVHGRGPTGRALRTGQITVARVLDADPDFEPWRRNALERGYSSSIALPFRVGAEVTGTLNIYSVEPDAFDDKERELLAELALDLGHGVQTLRERHAAAGNERRVAHLGAVLTGIRSVNQLILRERDPKVLLQRVAELFVQGRSFDACCIATCSGTRLERAAAAGAQDSCARLDELLASCDMETGNLRGTGRAAGQLPGDDGDVIVVRMQSNGTGYGLILASLPQGLHADDEKIALLREAAADVAFALHNIDSERDRTAAKRALSTSNARLQRLAAAVRDLSAAHDVATIAAIVRSTARALLSADGATFVLRDGDECHYVDEEAIAPLWKGQRFPMSACISGWVMLHREHAIIEDIYTDPRIPHEAYRPTFVKSLVMVPIRRDAPLGSIGIYWAEHHRATPDEVELLQALADSTSIAVERVRTLHQLELSEDRYRGLVENLEDIVYSLDAEGRFVYLSPSVSRYGYTADELIGRSFASVVHEADLEQLGASLQRALAGEVETHVFRARDKQGRERTVRTSSRVTVSHGRPVGISGVLVDITDLKRTEEQLRVAQKMEAVGQLAGGIAHDFNNLLAVILSYAGFVSDEVHDRADVQADVEEIRKAGTRAASLTRQLLAFSRKQVLAPQVLSLNRLATDLERMLQRVIGEDIELVQVLAPDLDHVKADPGQIEQVVMNLVVNARDAMPHGGKLTIETANVNIDDEHLARHPAGKPGPSVMLAVSDTGCGMDEATKQRIFEPFFTTKDTGKGTGLGLSTVYGIVEQSGGSIYVYSELGVGTTFKIYLPRVTDDIDTRHVRESTRPPVGTETILLVEDDQAVRNLAVRILNAAGYHVLSAADGASAIVVCASHPDEIDLLVTDVVMPQMSGRQLADRLTERQQGLRVLYMSGYTDNAIERHGVLEPGTQFIAKPFSAFELARKVRDTLDSDAS